MRETPAKYNIFVQGVAPTKFPSHGGDPAKSRGPVVPCVGPRQEAPVMDAGTRDLFQFFKVQLPLGSFDFISQTRFAPSGLK